MKQWIGNKVQGTKYETMWNNSQTALSQMKDLYEAERARNVGASAQTVFLQASQTVLMDALIKMALASKLDSTDKASIVANVERLKLMAPAEIIQEVTTKSENVITNVYHEIEANPAQTVVNISNAAGSLLEKYTEKRV